MIVVILLYSQLCNMPPSFPLSLSVHTYSVEENEEKLWNKTLELLKDHLSPAIFEKYGPSTTPTPDPSGTSAPSGGESVPLVQEPVPLSASADGELEVEQEGRNADGDQQ